MANLDPYRVTLTAFDYPAKYDGLLTALQPYLTEVENGRQGQASIADNFSRYFLLSAGFTQNVAINGYRLTGAAAGPYASNELIPRSYADSLAFASALPAISADTYGLGITTDGATAEWGDSSADAAATLNAWFGFF